jgi:hypothetical protein
VTVRGDGAPAERCGTLLVQYGRDDRAEGAPEGWRAVWEGRRRGDDTERYVLYARVAP